MWQPIEDLPANWNDYIQDDLHLLAVKWNEQKTLLQDSNQFNSFQERLRRRIAIETGVIERLYTIDRGTTQLLIERGIDEALIQHGTTNQPASQVVALIRDHHSAIQHVFDFVGAQRDLSNSFIKQLHQFLTRHQEFTDAIDQFGNFFQAELLRGEWKQNENNPRRPDGSIHYYCPPEQVAAQMDQLITWHLTHQKIGISPEVEAAWLHHRFTQIHPFQDGNGRVARLLASLIFIRADWLPLVITRPDHTETDRETYIKALEEADNGNLEWLVHLFVRTQRRELLSILSLSEEVLSGKDILEKGLDNGLALLDNRLSKIQKQKMESAQTQVQKYADELLEIAKILLGELGDKIRQRLANNSFRPSVRVDFANSSDERSTYYRYQIVETAKQLEYYANLRSYKSWVRLIIQVESLQTEILLSLHYAGHVEQHLMVCSAIGFRKNGTDGNDTSMVQDIEPLCDIPFQFSNLNESNSLAITYQKWLGNVMENALLYLIRGL